MRSKLFPYLRETRLITKHVIGNPMDLGRIGGNWLLAADKRIQDNGSIQFDKGQINNLISPEVKAL